MIGVPDEKWGEAVKALVVLKPGAEAAEADLIRLVRDAKGAVQAPKSIEFVEQLPVTGLGKLDKGQGIRRATGAVRPGRCIEERGHCGTGTAPWPRARRSNHHLERLERDGF